MQEDKNIVDLEKIAAHLEKSNFSSYVDLINKPVKFFWLNFLAGLFRGFGTAIGMTIVFAIALYFLIVIIKPFIQVPVLGSFLSDLLDFINSSAKQRLRY